MLISEILPDSLNDQARFKQTAQRQLNAFNWVKQGWIPLSIIVNDPKNSEGITYDKQWLDEKVFCEFQAKVLRDTLIVGSDSMPAACINHMGNAMIPTMFGTKIRIPDDEVKTITASVGPWIYPNITDASEIDSYEASPLPCGLVTESEKVMKYYKKNLPAWVQVGTPSKLGTFSTAELLRGADMYTDMVMYPDQIKKLFGKVTQALIDAERYLRAAIDMPSDEFYSEYNIRGPGLRLGDDSLITISPDMIEEFIFPEYEKLAKAFSGKAYLHFCSLDGTRYEQIYEAVMDCPYIAAVSSQFGFEYYENNVDRLEGKLAIESLYGDFEPEGARGVAQAIKTHGSFENWANYFVPKFKDRSGLILYFEVRSIEEGKLYWDNWQKAHEI